MRKVLFCLGTLFCLFSCSFPNHGITIGNGGTADIILSDLSLKWDFTKKCDPNFILDDCEEFKFAHNILPPGTGLTGEIKSFKDILWMADSFESSRKPSIKVTLHCHSDLEDKDTTVTKTFTWDEVGPLELYQIPYRDDIFTGEVEIKSCKTMMHGLQVVWKKTASGPNWPINEFIKDGEVSPGNAPAPITKGGTNNSNGNVAANSGGIIPNTIEDILEYEELIEGPIEVEIELEPIYSPSLAKPFYINGTMSEKVEWGKPNIYKTKNL